MGWSHPAVAVEEVLGLVRGFVDLLVLAGGRTSSGAAANWSCGEVKNALRWALFFEEVSGDLPGLTAPCARDQSRLRPVDGMSTEQDLGLPPSQCRFVS
jgi:hypothetical protein